ncbi:MAG: Tim44/TimA family putative adaptor protein [Rhodospirillales bacterium]|jgi:predicted lipid-binding transport protein (Tim44 family)|nr:translocase [Rhodospirillaceae bacterium]MDP6428337.1 Tim44/TimA family putative adaptor protein [Rhodospirillales bacterium]MDP6642582.1 Tim44/TimA family putative adaptor protein [Rhodospirillales bacterium]MDP6842339.1 Tim44/TimA family putative adaptor protein [Rhodospirillales bacterium]|tara:strand:+ start:1492 stop:2202 length:711 start_codon:yes stop_codon:yes gene_type:complete
MGEGFQFIDIILFAMIAAFLILRLRNVLGRHKDHGRPQKDPFTPDPQAPDPHSPAKDDNVIQLPDQGNQEFTEDETPVSEDSAQASPLDQGFADIRAADNSFDASEFIAGARAAFEMIVEAFAKGDRETLNSLLNDEVYNNFVTAIHNREENNETLENTLIRLVSNEAIEAYVENSIGLITVKIISEQVNVTRNADGEVVDGNSNQISEITDIWTFARDLGSRNPNWQLVATRSLD